MDLGIPPRKIEIVRASNPLKSTIVVGKLGVAARQVVPPDVQRAASQRNDMYDSSAKLYD